MLLDKMDLNASDFINQICAEYGRDEDAKSQWFVSMYMQLFSVKALISPDLFKLYVKREYAKYLHGQLLEQQDRREGDVDVKNHFLPVNYQQQIAQLTAEIATIERQALAMASTIGQMTAVVPGLSPAGRFPASSPTFIGGPDAPRWFRR